MSSTAAGTWSSSTRRRIRGSRVRMETSLLGEIRIPTAGSGETRRSGGLARNYLTDLLERCVRRVIYLDSDLVLIDDAASWSLRARRGSSTSPSTSRPGGTWRTWRDSSSAMNSGMLLRKRLMNMLSSLSSLSAASSAGMPPSN